MRRIHIVGAGPRTGTTLLAEVMIACFDIDQFTDHEDRLFSRAESGGDVYLTKHPRDVLIVGPSLKVDPDLYVLYMIRDPRDMVCSKHRIDPDRYWASLRYWHTHTQYARQLKNHPRFIEIRYEDFVSEPDTVQKVLMEAMPFLTMKAPFSQFHEVAHPCGASEKALGGVRPIRPKSVGKWRDHKERVAGQLELHDPITEDLIEFGYEENDAWLSEMKGIEPDTRPSHWPEFFTEDEIINRKSGRNKEALKRLLERLGVDPVELKRWVPFYSSLKRGRGKKAIKQALEMIGLNPTRLKKRIL